MATPRLFFLMDRAHRALFRAADREMQNRLGISSAQLGLLFYIGAHENCLMGELAAGLDLRPNAVTGLIQRLKRDGFVETSPSERDRRATHLQLTDRGREAVRDAVPVVQQANQQLIGDFSDAEIAVIARFFTHVIDLPSPQTLSQEPSHD